MHCPPRKMREGFSGQEETSKKQETADDLFRHPLPRTRFNRGEVELTTLQIKGSVEDANWICISKATRRISLNDRYFGVSAFFPKNTFL